MWESIRSQCFWTQSYLQEDAIIEFAEKENIDMIILGSTGTSSLKKILIGSVASAVVTKAKCIVTVVK